MLDYGFIGEIPKILGMIVFVNLFVADVQDYKVKQKSTGISCLCIKYTP